MPHAARSSSDRDLVGALRTELAAIDPPRGCCRRAETIGLAGALEGRRGGVARLALRLRRPRDEGGDLGEFDWEAAAEHCRAAYLRGLFLAHGSLSLSGGRTHLEFAVSPAEAPILAARLEALELKASWRLRRGRGVVTWKSSERVGTFLRYVGAGSALLEIEARQVARTVRGELNRVINAESANLQRGVTAALRQLEAIELLEADGRLAVQPYAVRVVAEARRETPEATFSELAERLGLHRSAVQRAFDRLERLALHPEDRETPWP